MTSRGLWPKAAVHRDIARRLAGAVERYGADTSAQCAAPPINLEPLSPPVQTLVRLTGGLLFRFQLLILGVTIRARGFHFRAGRMIRLGDLRFAVIAHARFDQRDVHFLLV
jgi:hypothetical protein